MARTVGIGCPERIWIVVSAARPTLKKMASLLMRVIPVMIARSR